MDSWQELLRKKSIATLEALVAKFGPEHFPDLERLRQAAENFEFRISPAMVELITSPGDPIWRRYVPRTAASARDGARWAIPRRSPCRSSSRRSATSRSTARSATSSCRAEI